jgi:hypothetical protein
MLPSFVTPLCWTILRCAVPCCAGPYIKWCLATLGLVTDLRRAVLCLLCWAMLDHAMLCRAVPCCAGPYIKWFLEKLGHDGLNRMLGEQSSLRGPQGGGSSANCSPMMNAATSSC